jgi:hypothetical protein
MDRKALAGVEGFEPPNGGIKTRYMDQHNQQVTDTTAWLAPLGTLRFPIAATKPATSDWVNGGHPRPGSRAPRTIFCGQQN